MHTPNEAHYTVPAMTPQVSVVVTSADDPKERKLQLDEQPTASHSTEFGINAGWDASFFGCFSSLVPNCCMSTICPCVSIAQIRARLGKPFNQALLSHGANVFGIVVCIILLISHSVTTDKKQENIRGQREIVERSQRERQIMFACGALLVSLFYAASVCRLRMRVRKQYEIKGYCGVDCFIAMFCAPCAVAQMASQTQSYIPGNCSFQAPNGVETLPAYSTGSAPMLAPVAFI